jgi:amino acid adenylation domain-containing protein/non-ribosomal peptide synthase protein (TIGR01720 family)
VKVRGFRIELGEIESVLVEHAAVSEAVVVALEEEGDKKLVAYLVKSEASALDARALRDYLLTKLPAYMVPTSFVFLEAFALNANKKIDRSLLPDPDTGEVAGSGGEYVAPRTATEAALAEIWQEILKIGDFSVHDSFFDLGGHSLMATQVVSRIRNTFEITLPLRALFEAPTVAQLAERITATSDIFGDDAPPLTRARREGTLALSFAQQRLWFIHQMDPESSAYNLPIALKLTGALDQDALQKALEEIVRRHEVLRTTFQLIGETPAQVIHPASDLPLPMIDLSALAESKKLEEARHLTNEEARRPFDLEFGPLFRVSLVRLAGEEHILLLSMHHIVSDGWSHGVLIREFATLYNAFRIGQPSPLPDLAIQYADYAVWQRGWLQGDVLQRQLSYWSESLANAPAALDLPMDRPRPALQSFSGANKSIRLSAGLTKSLRDLGKREGATLFMTLLATFQVLLSRYSGQQDVVVGTPIANRTHNEVEGLIGFFVNTLALRGDLSGDPSFRELLARTREVSLGAFAHQDLPFERLVDELQPERSMSHSPIFQVVFSMQNAPQSALDLQGLAVESVGAGGVSAKFDLQLTATEGAAGLALSLAYNTDLFDADRMERFLGHYRTLLEGIVSNPDERISRLPLLTEPERDQLLVDWNDTTTDYPKDRCVHTLFEEQAVRTPDATAVVCGDQSITYSALNARSNQLAHYLKKQGVGRETLVGLCLERSIAMIVGLLGILKAGGAYLPLDPSYPAERLAFMLQDSRPALVLSQRSLLEGLEGHDVPVVCLDDLSFCDQEDSCNGDSGSLPDSLVYVMYTSGSTGIPKGIEIPHRAVARLVKNTNYCRFGPSETFLQFAPLSFDASTLEIWGCLLTGGRLVVFEGSSPSLAELGQVIRDEKVSTLWLTASLFQAMVDDQLESLTSVSQLLAGGDVLSVPHVSRALEALPGCQLINGYGPTENTTFTCCYAVPSSGCSSSRLPIGRPISHTQVYILDSHLHPVPVGVAGELYAGGDGLGRGYLNRADLTAEKFVPDPFSKTAGARLYKTGDLCRYLSDGNIEFLARVDHQVKIRGFRIELGEIESVLLALPGVTDAVVLAREDTPGDKRLVGYVVSDGSEASSGSSLRDHLRSRLPDYMVPSAFVLMDALPLSHNGKVDRKALPKPDMTRPEMEIAYEEAHTPIEKALAEIWADVLRLEQVGIHDNFFELGGDSILSIQIIARANRAGLGLSARHVFQHQTIAELAEFVGSGSTVETRDELIIHDAPLTPIQQWFIECGLSEPNHFNMSRLVVLHQNAAIDAVEKAVSALIEQHETLRLRLARSEQGWRQSIAPLEGSVVEWIDLSGLAEAERGPAITEEATRLQKSLNLETGSVFRAAYFDLGPGSPPRLLLLMHHMAVDGVSLRILLDDLQIALQQAGNGEAISLPAKTTPFLSWAVRLHEHAQTSKLREQMAYWAARSRRDVTAIPIDFPKGVNTFASQQSVRMSLDPEETKNLLQEVPAAYHTQINDVLLTALAQSLASFAGGDRFLIDMEGHGREALFDDFDHSRTLGWFTSMYPVLLELPFDNAPSETIKAIKEQVRQIPEKGVSYGLLRYLSDDPAVRSELASLPEVEISFNYHGVFDQVVRDSEIFGIASESAGPGHDPNSARSHIIDVMGQVTDGRLQMAFLYSENLHERGTIERFAFDYMRALRSLIEHCTQSDAGGYTPSDFPKARVSQKALDALLASFPKK